MGCKLNVTVIVAACVLDCLAMNELGSLTKAQHDHPAVFVPGNVLEYSIAGVDGYVFNGESEQCFVGDLKESDSELFREAVVDARQNIYQRLTKGDKLKTVELSGVAKIYEYVEGKMYRVVCFVPASRVKVKTKVEPMESTTKTVDAEKQDVANMPKMEQSVSPSQGMKVSDGAANSEHSNDRLAVLAERYKSNPKDCVLCSKLARAYARVGKSDEATMIYASLADLIVCNEKMNKDLASDLLLEIAGYFENEGDFKSAIKYYRLLLRCDSLRRWGMSDSVNIANRKVSQLLLK